MTGISRTPADDAFSLCIRERANWTCEYCGKADTNAQIVGRSIYFDCAHIYGRRARRVRFHPDNAVCLCKGCHRQFTEHPREFTGWVESHIGTGRLDLVNERRNDAAIKYTKKDLADIAKHYRNEFKRLRKLRGQGIGGRLEFIGYE